MKTWKQWARIEGDECDGFVVVYEVVKGRPQRMRLDATTESDAFFETAAHTEIPEKDIERG